LMLRYFLLNNQTPQTLSVVTTKGIQNFAFKMIRPEETINSALDGNLSATHIRFTDNDGNQIDQWLAKKYNYLPVVIKVSKNGVVSSAIYLTAVH
jgi:hypothetical protein